LKKSDNIILIGYRGTGKSVVAEELAKLTGKKFVSLDAEIEKKYGPITDIVKFSGWEKFREIETEVLKTINIENGIIDCGGGIIESAENFEILNTKGKVFWLKASLNTIHSRLNGKTNRPALTENGDFLQEISDVLKRRKPLYQNAADSEINTDGKSPFEIANEMLTSILKPKICIPIVEKNIEDAINAIHSANAKADVIELRIDFLENVDTVSLEKLLDVVEKPVIVTCRLENQGGTGKITEENRQDLLAKAIEKKVDFIDLEFTSKTKISEKQSTLIIRSHHNFEKTPSIIDIKSILSAMKTKSAEIIKYIPTANSINDNFRIFEILQKSDDIISFCMGLKGHISRVLAGKYGSLITFAANAENQKSAPGQINIDEMKNLYNFSDINRETQVFGVMGEFAENSKSKYMHNPAFKENNVNAVYLPFKIDHGKDLENFMNNFREFHFAGSAVTIPHKETVMQYLHELDETAKAIGAVNTIKSNNGKLIGYNTDCVGAINALKEKVELAGKTVLVIGAGGAARAIVYGLDVENAEVTIVNRTFEKAQKLADEFSVKSIGFVKLNIDKFDVFVNTTSVGMYPDVDSSVLDSFPKNRVVMDIVYKPLKTKFLQIAEECGCEVITGEKMLIHQAIAQQKIWTGNEPDFDFMSECFFKIKE